MTITMNAGGISNGDVVCTDGGYPVARVAAVSKANAGRSVRCCLSNCLTGEIESVIDYPADQTVTVERDSL